MPTSREELLHTAVQRFMAVMRQMRHPGPPPGLPPPLSPPQANVLFTVAQHHAGVSVKELSEAIGVTPGAVTQFIDALVEKGLVTREGDPSDRRVVRLKISESANRLFQKFRDEHMLEFYRLFTVLTDDEINQLIGLLDKIVAARIVKEKPNAESDKTP